MPYNDTEKGSEPSSEKLYGFIVELDETEANALKEEIVAMNLSKEVLRTRHVNKFRLLYINIYNEKDNLPQAIENLIRARRHPYTIKKGNIVIKKVDIQMYQRPELYALLFKDCVSSNKNTVVNTAQDNSLDKDDFLKLFGPVEVREISPPAKKTKNNSDQSVSISDASIWNANFDLSLDSFSQQPVQQQPIVPKTATQPQNKNQTVSAVKNQPKKLTYVIDLESLSYHEFVDASETYISHFKHKDYRYVKGKGKDDKKIFVTVWSGKEANGLLEYLKNKGKYGTKVSLQSQPSNTNVTSYGSSNNIFAPSVIPTPRSEKEKPNLTVVQPEPTSSTKF